MSKFYDRYKKSCAAIGIDPCSQTTAECIGVTRSAIGSWSTKGVVPKGETVARIADVLQVSADYLLGRTNVPSDCNIYNSITPDLASLLQKAGLLNETGLQKVSSYVDGLLESEQFRKGSF